MSWRLIFALSLFGLAMAIGTVYVIPSNIEPLIWLAIFVICALVIALRAPGKWFLHGLLLGLVNSVWVTGIHVALLPTYLAHHAREAAMMSQGTMPLPGRAMVLVIGPIVGLCTGVVIGLLAMLAHWLMRRPKAATPAGPA